MSVQDFQEYAAAFEQAFESDDWSLIRPCFTQNAVYEIAGGPPFGKTVRGLENIVSGFQSDVNSFDRKFDQRIVQFVKPPYETDAVVHARWRAVYRKEGVPDLELRGEEQAYYEGNRIHRLVSTLDESEKQKVIGWLSEYGKSLGLEQ